jgi:hypothetical protein
MRKLSWVLTVLAVLSFTGLYANADSTCFSTYISGTGPTYLNFCISQDGNIASFESPRFSTELVGEEGYAVASKCGTLTATTHGADAGFAEGGFGTPTIVQPNGSNTFPLTIMRDTTDGVFRLKQSFSRDTTEKDVTITMTLTNLSTSAVSNVFLTRYFTDGLFISFNRFARSFDSVWGWDGYGFSLTDLTFATTHSTVVQTRNSWLSGGTGGLGDGCVTTSAVDTDTASGQLTNGWAGRVVYQLGTMNAAASKTVKVVYRRY